MLSAEFTFFGGIKELVTGTDEVLGRTNNCMNLHTHTMRARVHTHARTHARTHAYTHTHTHTHTQKEREREREREREKKTNGT